MFTCIKKHKGYIYKWQGLLILFSLKKTIKMRVLLFVLFALSSNFIFSQKVTGVIISDKTPIEYANVLLYQSKDSLFVGAGLSDTTGYFSINLPSQLENYYLYIQVIHVMFDPA